MAPPASTKRVGDEVPVALPLTCVKSPKSNALPNVAMVIKSTALVTLGVVPSVSNPLTALPPALPLWLVTVVSPKSAESPCVAIVIN